MAASAAARVIVTRRLPSSALSKLQNASPALDIVYHDDDEPMTRDELLSKASSGVDGFYCLLSVSIDKSVLVAAG